MKLTKPLVFLDTETTGLSVVKDRIIEISMIRANVDGSFDELYSLFDPTPNTVSEEAASVHGKTTESLIGSPKFEDKAAEILEFIKGADLCGYNIFNFDIPILVEEFFRAKRLFDYRSYKIIDIYRVWAHFEPRTLQGAYQRFVKKEMPGKAHTAHADTEACLDILQEQLNEWNINIEDIPEIQNTSNVDLAGKFGRNGNSELILTFGKHSHKTVNSIAAEDPEYFRWMYEKAEMPTETKLIALKIFKSIK